MSVCLFEFIYLFILFIYLLKIDKFIKLKLT